MEQIIIAFISLLTPSPQADVSPLLQRERKRIADAKG